MRHAAYFQQPDAAQLRHEIQQSVREQVRQNVEAAREQARAQAEAARAQAAAAREQARAAREAARAATGAAPEAPTAPEVPLVSVPPVTVPLVGMPQFPAPDMIPPQAVDIAMGFFFTIAVIIVGWPLARAIGRRIEKRGEQPAIGPEVSAQLQRIEHAVEAMAIEVERISEAQRYMAKVQSGAAREAALKSASE